MRDPLALFLVLWVSAVGLYMVGMAGVILYSLERINP